MQSNILNYGSGENKFKDAINVDAEASVNPDIICDIKKGPLPFDDAYFDEVRWFHSIEHVEQKHWHLFFTEFFRVLKPEGRLLISYPEFEIVAHAFINNYKGMRDFWRMTLYGRQLYAGDYHVVPMVSSELASMLVEFGFTNVKYVPEPIHYYNSFLSCNKAEAIKNYEEVMMEEAFS